MSATNDNRHAGHPSRLPHSASPGLATACVLDLHLWGDERRERKLSEGPGTGRRAGALLVDDVLGFGSGGRSFLAVLH